MGFGADVATPAVTSGIPLCEEAGCRSEESDNV
jgi:hypothetical protein